MIYFAHTIPGVSDTKYWELLLSDPTDNKVGHLNRVANYCIAFVKRMSMLNSSAWEAFCELLGLWHDLGKFQEEFQRYLRDCVRGVERAKVDHSLAGALFAAKEAFSPDIRRVGDLLAYAIAGHHAGLSDGTKLFDRRFLKDLGEWKSHVPAEVLACNQAEKLWRENAIKIRDGKSNASLPGFIPLLMDPSSTTASRGFAIAMQVRMLFSLLVDADRLATEEVMSPDKAKLRPTWPDDILALMSRRLETYLADKEAKAGESLVAHLRGKIHRVCYEAAGKDPGVYQLNVPTGGGKTFSSLSFALKHACIHEMQRVIYVIPYTSIIDQTAREFRSVFEPMSKKYGHNCVFEHHSAVRREHTSQDEDLEVQLDQLAENWDAPVIVTTSVQFFESLFANSPSAARKLHNIANSTIIFDEAQTLPSHLLIPCLEAMKALQRDYHCTLVLCTATQPALVRQPWFPYGWERKEMNSLIGREMEQELSRLMKRVKVYSLGELNTKQLVLHISSQPERCCLCIVNLTRQAQELYRELRESLPSDVHLFHLSARMCSVHREETTERVIRLLACGEPVILVATRVVEAGVDISFPVVYRDRAGVDSLAQAAGRCNRHGEIPDGGRVYRFTSTDFEIPSCLQDLKTAAISADDALRCGNYDDPMSAEAVNDFFCRYYRDRREQTDLGENVVKFTSLKSVEDDMYRVFDFAKVDAHFRLIDSVQHQVMIPWGENGEKLREELRVLDRNGQIPDRKLYRQIHRLCVSVYGADWDMLQQKGLVETYCHDTIAVISTLDQVYDPEFGFQSLATYDPNQQVYIS